jgi:tetratricopeptide (TPR) repeat protein
LYSKAYDIAIELDKKGSTIQSKRDVCISCNYLGEVAFNRKIYKLAENWYLQGFEIAKALFERSNTYQAKNDLILSYDYMGNVSKELGKLDEAKKYYLKEIELSEKGAKTVSCLDDLAFLYYKYGALTNQMEYLRKSHKIYADLANKCPNNQRYVKNRDILAKKIN